MYKILIGLLLTSCCGKPVVNYISPDGKVCIDTVAKLNETYSCNHPAHSLRVVTREVPVDGKIQPIDFVLCLCVKPE